VSPSPLASTIMLPDFVASDDDVIRQSNQSYHGGLIVPEVGQASLPQGGTINPMLLMGEHELLLHNPSLNSSYIYEDSHYQHTSPAPSSVETWMGYPGDEASASAPSPVGPIIGNTEMTYVAFMESCICGCDGGPCIPQRDYDRQRTDPLSQHDLQEMILFRVNGRCGYPLVDALKKRYTGLDGRDDKMFVDFKSSISIRLEWLSYDKWTRQIRTLTWRKKPDNIARSKLATEVAKRMKIFFEEMAGKAVNSHPEYRVQPGIIDLEHLELVALKRVAKSSYMPHFRLIAS